MPVVQRSEIDLLEEILERIRLAEAQTRLRDGKRTRPISLSPLDQTVISFLVANPLYHPGAYVEVHEHGYGRIAGVTTSEGGPVIVVKLNGGQEYAYPLGYGLSSPQNVRALDPDEPPF